GAIDPDTAEADAKPSTNVTVVAAAMIAVSMARLRAIEHPHRAAATAAAHQSGQQGSAAAGRLAIGPTLHMGVLRDQLLVLLVLFPADVARGYRAAGRSKRTSASNGQCSCGRA